MVHAVNEPRDPNPRGGAPKSVDDGFVFFTPEEATVTLPLVRRIARDVMELRLEIDAQAAQVAGLGALHSASLTEHGVFAEEVEDIRDSLAADKDRLDDHVRELESLGVVVHESRDGHFDFRTMLDRRTVHLCWHLDETSVTHWHEVGEEASRRRDVRGHLFRSRAN